MPETRKEQTVLENISPLGLSVLLGWSFLCFFVVFFSAELQPTSVLSTGTLCIHSLICKYTEHALHIYQEQVRKYRRKEGGGTM